MEGNIEEIKHPDLITWPQKDGWGKSLTPESQAIAALAIGKAIRFPCRWSHYDVKRKRANGDEVVYEDASCGGAGLAHNAARRNDIVIRASCIKTFANQGKSEHDIRHVYVQRLK